MESSCANPKLLLFPSTYGIRERKILGETTCTPEESALTSSETYLNILILLYLATANMIDINMVPYHNMHHIGKVQNALF